MNLSLDLVGTHSTASPMSSAHKDGDAVERVPTRLMVPARARKGMAALREPSPRRPHRLFAAEPSARRGPALQFSPSPLSPKKRRRWVCGIPIRGEDTNLDEIADRFGTGAFI